MSQARDRKTDQRLRVSGKRQPLTASREHPLDRESRLRREEDEARWKRMKEMIVIWSVAYISLGSFTVWAIVLLSGSYSSTEKQILTGFLIQLLFNLYLFLAGKRPSFKK
jgi:hypothetical protein